jgi:ankyrin repeat protein
MRIGKYKLFDKTERFLRAMREGDVDSVRKFLEKNPDSFGEFEYVSHKNGNILHMAAYYNHPALVEFLVQANPVLLNRTNRYGNTPLHHACMNQAQAAAKMLLNLGADSRRKNNEGDIPSDHCESGDMKELFRDVIEEQRRQKTALEEKKRQEQARLQAEESRKTREQADLFAAIAAGHLEQVKIILEASPAWLEKHIDTYTTGKSGYLLHIAAHFNRPELIRYLVRDKSFPVDKQNTAGNTPLHHACMNSAPEAALTLLELGADPWLKNKEGKSPAAEATSAAVKPLFRPLIEQAEARKQWSLTAPCEVVHARTLSGAGYHLTDVFNFHTRRWTSITKDVKSGHIAQDIFFFDDVSDKQILKDALEYLHVLGGQADPDVIDRRPIDKPKPAGMGG